MSWYKKTSGQKYEFAVYKLADYTESLGSSHAQDGATPEYFTDYAKEIIPEEFLDLN